ncbi:hypothetical protein R3P38DRAFT_1775448 [Favolaschia claudopus]|uniref:Protein kinase domain-containing protein n=1 Tax=Favolaschia claudopus TaxID=2862362 RepID=A0AAW0A7M8_9AGAR
MSQEPLHSALAFAEETQHMSLFRPRVQASFYQCRNVTINGGNFTLQTQSSEPELENFRRIPVGDVVLRENLAVVQRVGWTGKAVRHVHSARVVGVDGAMTAAIFEGENVKEEWDNYIAIHLKLRHPNVFQLYGISHSEDLHVAIYHQEHVPIACVRKSYSATPTHAIYFELFVKSEFLAHAPYIQHVCKISILSSTKCTTWIQTSGILCIEMTPPSPSQGMKAIIMSPPHASPSIRTSKCLARELPEMIEFIGLDDYHNSLLKLQFCQYQKTPLAEESTVRPFSVVAQVEGELDVQTIAHLAQSADQRLDWSLRTSLQAQVMRSKWSRIRAHELYGSHTAAGTQEYFQLWVCYSAAQDSSITQAAYLTQVNYVLSCVGNNRDPQAYSFVASVEAHIKRTYNACRCPDAYLFLPPQSAFLTSDRTRIQYPSLTPFWSRDPGGGERLSEEEAVYLGLPTIEIEIEVKHALLCDGVHEALCEFYQGKGFDPDSAQIAKQLNLPMMHFPDEADPYPLRLCWRNRYHWLDHLGDPYKPLPRRLPSEPEVD